MPNNFEMMLTRVLVTVIMLSNSNVTVASIAIPYKGSRFSQKRSSKSWRPNAFSATPPVPRSRISSSSSSLKSAAAFIDVSSAVSAVNMFYEQFPYFSAFLTCAVKGSAADFVAQKKTRKQPKLSTVRTSRSSSDTVVDVKQNMSFLLYGGIYQGMAQEYIYNRLFPMLFGHGSDMATVVTKVAFNMGIVTPIMTLPTAYITKALVYKKPIKEGIQSYWFDVRKKGLLKKFWAIWVPVQSITFSVIPEHMRISFIAFVSFFWLIVFSSIS